LTGKSKKKKKLIWRSVPQTKGRAGEKPTKSLKGQPSKLKNKLKEKSKKEKKGETNISRQPGNGRYGGGWHSITEKKRVNAT